MIVLEDQLEIQNLHRQGLSDRRRRAADRSGLGAGGKHGCREPELRVGNGGGTWAAIAGRYEGSVLIGS